MKFCLFCKASGDWSDTYQQTQKQNFLVPHSQIQKKCSTQNCALNGQRPLSIIVIFCSLILLFSSGKLVWSRTPLCVLIFFFLFWVVVGNHKFLFYERRLDYCLSVQSSLLSSCCSAVLVEVFVFSSSLFFVLVYQQ